MHDTDTERQSEPVGRRGVIAFAVLLAGAALLAACGGVAGAGR